MDWKVIQSRFFSMDAVKEFPVLGTGSSVVVCVTIGNCGGGKKIQKNLYLSGSNDKAMRKIYKNQLADTQKQTKGQGLKMSENN